MVTQWLDQNMLVTLVPASVAISSPAYNPNFSNYLGSSRTGYRMCETCEHM